jgi:hypothetical protein
MAACPSRLELSRWEARPEPDRPPEFTVHVGTCARCSSILADISDARALLLGADPAEASARAARVIFETAQQRKGLRRWLKYLVPVLLVPATAALLVLARPSLPSHGSGIKGGLIVETYCKREGRVFPAVDGGDYRVGDQLRFAYTQDRPGFLLVFGVDDTGKVFPYYEEDALVGTPVQPGARVFLPGSVQLDAHKGWERIYLLWTQSPLPDSAVRPAVAASLSAANGDLRRTSALDLPVEQVSLLLRRP